MGGTAKGTCAIDWHLAGCHAFSGTPASAGITLITHHRIFPHLPGARRRRAWADSVQALMHIQDPAPSHTVFRVDAVGAELLRGKPGQGLTAFFSAPARDALESASLCSLPHWRWKSGILVQQFRIRCAGALKKESRYRGPGRDKPRGAARCRRGEPPTECRAHDRRRSCSTTIGHGLCWGRGLRGWWTARFAARKQLLQLFGS